VNKFLFELESTLEDKNVALIVFYKTIVIANGGFCISRNDKQNDKFCRIGDFMKLSSW
jgi:hypothetical protein